MREAGWLEVLDQIADAARQMRASRVVVSLPKCEFDRIAFEIRDGFLMPPHGLSSPAIYRDVVMLVRESHPPPLEPPLPGVVPVAYEFTDVPDVRIEWRGVNSWAVIRAGDVLTRDGRWEREPRPSNRTEEFKVNARWPSVADAVAALHARRAGDG